MENNSLAESFDFVLANTAIDIIGRVMCNIDLINVFKLVDQ